MLGVSRAPPTTSPLGIGDHGQALETFAEAMRFPIVRV